MYEFSIIIPVYNEEKLIEINSIYLLDYLNKEFPKSNFEIIICSNGSDDKTIEIGKKLEKKYKEIIFLKINEKDAGLAFKYSLEKARYDNILSLDMDLSSDLNFINQSLDLLLSNHIVIGSKKLGNQKRSIFRLILSKTYLFLVKFLLGINFSDYSISSKAYKKKSIKPFIGNEKGTFYVIKLIYFGYKNGLSMIEIPVDCKDNRKSKFNLYYEVFDRFWKLLKFFFTKS